MPATAKSKRGLRTLARLHGIQVTYRDGTGVKREVSENALRVLLTGMHVDCASDEEVRREIKVARARSKTVFLDSVYLLWEGQSSSTWWVNLPVEDGRVDDVFFSWTFVDESGRRQCFERKGRECSVIGKKAVEGQVYVRVSLPYPTECQLGYYRLEVTATGLPAPMKGTALVIVAPQRCYVPKGSIRAWGLTAQLYGLRSTHNWGIGDFSDLARLAEWAGPQLRVDTIGLNPLHALAPTMVSPYSPSSRLFLNPLYLDVEAIEECQSREMQGTIHLPQFQGRLQDLRSSETVDYPAVKELKDNMLEELYRIFVERHVLRDTERSQAFERFRAEEGKALERFAVFQVLQEQHKGLPWNQWPGPFQNPESAEVGEFARRNHERLGFYQYIQWECRKQLQDLSRTMAQEDIKLGLYHDLAIGIHPDGADAWMFQEHMAQGVEIGAPPDTFNLSGQTWGLQPPIPALLRESGYQFIRDTFHHCMEHGGMLRIDHALGLFRLYWVPTGCKGSEGAYVQYPAEELLAILALESVRHRVVVVGEDLGTVTPAIRKRLAQAGLLSYRLLMFEQTGRHEYRPPRHYPEQALSSVTTHDLPTLRGFWTGRDIDVKEQIGLYPSQVQVSQDRLSRSHDRKALLHALEKEGLLPKGISRKADNLKTLPDEVCRAVYAYLARSDSWVIATSLEDLLGEVETPNVPGAPEDRYPVWRRKLSRTLEEIRQDRTLFDFSTAVRRERETSARREAH